MKRILVFAVVLMVVLSSLAVAGIFDSKDMPKTRAWDGVKSFKMGIDGGVMAPTAASQALSDAVHASWGGSVGFILTEDFETDICFTYLGFGESGNKQPFYVGGVKTKYFMRDLYQSNVVIHPYLFNVTGISSMKRVAVSEAKGTILAEDAQSDSFLEMLAEAGGVGIDWMPYKNIWVNFEVGYYDYGEGFQFVMAKLGTAFSVGW